MRWVILAVWIVALGCITMIDPTFPVGMGDYMILGLLGFAGLVATSVLG